MDRYTLRVYDGTSHYDFPCKRASDGQDNEVYHSVVKSYPIRAVYNKSSNVKCDILRRVSSRMMSGRIVEKIKWQKDWRLQLYYVVSNGEKVLYYTGADVGTIKESDGVNQVLIDDVEINLRFENMSFDVDKNDNCILHKKGGRLNRMYNKKSQLLFIDLDKKAELSVTHG